jgi:hypothetical protein
MKFMKLGLFLLVIGSAVLLSGITGYSINSIFPTTSENFSDSQISSKKLTDAPIPLDIVTVTVNDKNGNLKSQQSVHNIVTGAGAVWFCIEQNRCTSQITGTVPAIPNIAAPTWWVQFVSGTANTNEPTSVDCSSPSGGGAVSGQVTTGRCVTNFGVAPAQYQAGGSIVTVSLTAGAAQLRTVAGTIDTTNNFVQTNRATVCSVTNDGTAPASGTCQFSDTTPVFTNQSSGPITINGLALSSGTASAATAGPLIIAETTITPVTLAVGDTISVTWTIVT